jgi:hypothetical protein
MGLVGVRHSWTMRVTTYVSFSALTRILSAILMDGGSSLRSICSRTGRSRFSTRSSCLASRDKGFVIAMVIRSRFVDRLYDARQVGYFVYLPRGQLTFVAEGSILDAGEVVRVTCYSGSGALRFDEVAEVLEREQPGNRFLVDNGKTLLLIRCPSFGDPGDDTLGLLA